MGLLDLFTKGAGEVISKPIEAIGDAADKIINGKDKAIMEYEEKIQELSSNERLARLDFNKSLAASANWIAINWIPILGLSAGFVFIWLYYFPMFIIAAWQQIHYTNTGKILPMIPYQINTNSLKELVFTLIGSGGIHAFTISRKK